MKFTQKQDLKSNTTTHYTIEASIYGPGSSSPLFINGALCESNNAVTYDWAEDSHMNSSHSWDAPALLGDFAITPPDAANGLSWELGFAYVTSNAPSTTWTSP